MKKNYFLHFALKYRTFYKVYLYYNLYIRNLKYLLKKSYSQFEEDLFLKTYFKNKKEMKILKEIEKTFVYELPPNLLGKIWKGKFRGQKQRWFIVRFFGDENEINLVSKSSIKMGFFEKFFQLFS